MRDTCKRGKVLGRNGGGRKTENMRNKHEKKGRNEWMKEGRKEGRKGMVKDVR